EGEEIVAWFPPNGALTVKPPSGVFPLADAHFAEHFTPPTARLLLDNTEVLEKCEAAIRRLALRLDKEPGNQTAAALWLALADEARAALSALAAHLEERGR